MTERIYVQIPAYRDSELLSTVQHMIQMAKHPDRLRVAIAWQYDAQEKLLEDQLRCCGNIELIQIPAADSQGCNWARHLLQKRWRGEPYTLFLDSHHRFVSQWDEQIVAIHEERRRAAVAKPIITAYLPPYNPHEIPWAEPHACTEFTCWNVMTRCCSGLRVTKSEGGDN